ncbi:sugar dehydrogenase complex small subunit [Pseudomonas asuensis]|uniref:Membrane bound FAD containing D-sorbitol dehydrogenase n=1 Tax=Pseudomonas asuensis TaxID=1825787 RepID=A0ABQ2GRT3_9PSED|nr:sugar dehydrogenase complex small subunit [Pseudomonas asuensis]GGM08646.1 hypothetical protein GCM10009425_19880 [Pseudomonas asuensis]
MLYPTEESAAPLKPQLSRRVFLAGSLAAAGWVMGRQLAPLAYAADVAGMEPAKAAFMNVSQVITGRTQLDPGLSQRLYTALSENDPAFTDRIQAVHQYIVAHQIAAADLQAALDRDAKDLTTLPRQLATAWYMGIVGEGKQARCIAFEDALMYAVVSDQLKPPSYAFGGYGSWAVKPSEA